MPERELQVVVAGSGVAGLTTALLLARAGASVTLFDAEDVPASADPDAAFMAPRRGAPQVHQTHVFLARTVVELRRHLPDVLDDLLAGGATTVPASEHLGDPLPGDEDLVLLIVRRTTYEWVLRNAVRAEPGAQLRLGTRVTGLAAAASGGPPSVSGVTLEDGSAVDADFVVAATGRRGDVLGWLRRHAVDVSETEHPTDLMYLSRWYRRRCGSPPAGLVRGVDSGYLKYVSLPGDADTLSITLAIRPDDREVRATLSDPERFDAACRRMPGPDTFFADGLTPLTGVLPMGGLINRLRRFVDADDRPAVLGFHAVGDAHTCTNPIYGRGCSLAFVQALLLAEAVARHGRDAPARAAAYEAASASEVEPWFHNSVEWDATSRAIAEQAAGSPRTVTPQQALFIAAEHEPVIARGLTRHFHLLASPAEMLADVTFLTKAAEVMTNPDRWPPPRRVGPRRDELLGWFAAEGVAS